MCMTNCFNRTTLGQVCETDSEWKCMYTLCPWHVRRLLAVVVAPQHPLYCSRQPDVMEWTVREGGREGGREGREGGREGGNYIAC